MTKAELQKDRDELKEEAESLQDELGKFIEDYMRFYNRKE